MDGKLVKLEKDYSSEVESAIKLTQTKPITQALEILLPLEKQTRVGSDAISNGKVLIQTVSLCFKSDLKLLNEYISILSKKHGLLKQAITGMFAHILTYLDQIPSIENKLALIETIRTNTDGKIYVEVERARASRVLSKIKETQGNVIEACDILQELQVETFGSMERREKTDFILEQMRLCLAKKDYPRVQIISRKISSKFFEDPLNQDLKLRFYELMIQHALIENSYLDICKYYRHIYNTPCIQSDETKMIHTLQLIILFIVMSPYDNEQADLIQRINQDSNLTKIPIFLQLLKCFITDELMRWPKITEIYGSSFKSFYVFDSSEDGQKRLKTLHSRIVEHNIRVVSKYYTRITFSRLENLLDLNNQETEAFLSKLVVSKMIYARIDRPLKVISFSPPKTAEFILNEWSFDINSLLSIVEKTNHLISKEEMNLSLK